jgi:hypothetical protein
MSTTGNKLTFRLLFAILINMAYIAFMLWIVHGIWTRKYPWFAIFLLLALLFQWPKIITAYSRSAVEDDSFFVNLSHDNKVSGPVTPQLIEEILGRQDVVQTIKIDLKKTGKITYREEWRLGLIMPDRNMSYFPNRMTPTRTAVLHSTDYFKPNNIAIANGVIKPKGLPKWSYGLDTQLNSGEFINIRNLKIENTSTTVNRNKSLPDFLREDGFPLKNVYTDGDPLTTDRGGTIVIDKEKLIIIYPHYFTQRRLIDDEGNLLNLGIDESFDHKIMFDVKMQPSLSRLLISRVSRQDFVPVVRYRSFPFVSDFMLSIIDTPMSASGWADVFVDPKGRAKLFIAKDKTEAEWYEMMDRLKELFQAELARKNNQLLGLTKDMTHLNEYFKKKHNILADYFIIQEFKLF